MVQLLVWLNSLALFPPILAPDTVRTPLPVLLTITLTGELLVPATCDGKLTAEGETVSSRCGRSRVQYDLNADLRSKASPTHC